MYSMGSVTDGVFSAGDIEEKTLMANKTIPIYNGYPDGTYKPVQIAQVKSGQPVGIVYSWIAADPTRGRNNLWWMFYPGSSGGSYYFAEQQVGYYDLDSLREQGVLTDLEKQAQADEQNKPWYLQLSDSVLPWAGGIILGGITIGALIRAALQKRPGNG